MLQHGACCAHRQTRTRSKHVATKARKIERGSEREGEQEREREKGGGRGGADFSKAQKQTQSHTVTFRRGPESVVKHSVADITAHSAAFTGWRTCARTSGASAQPRACSRHTQLCSISPCLRGGVCSHTASDCDRQLLLLHCHS